MKIRFTEELWKEGNMYVSFAPELNISACGETCDQARANLSEVVQINMEEMRKMGTLKGFLQEAGFELEGQDMLSVKKELLEFQAREITV